MLVDFSKVCPKFILLLVCATVFASAMLTEDELYILLNNDEQTHRELHCVHNGPQEKMIGLSWIMPPNVSHSRFNLSPRLHRYSFRNTEVTEFYPLNFLDHWMYSEQVNSFSANLPPILDDRWNELKELKTMPGTSPLLAIFTEELHFSVLANINAEIKILSTTSISPRTFSFKIDPVDDPGTLKLIECDAGSPRLKNCTVVANAKALHGTTFLKNGTEWVHFTIKIKNSNPSLNHPVLNISLSDAKSGKVLCEFVKDNANLPFSYAMAETPHSTGYWKPHVGHAIIHNGKYRANKFKVVTTASRTDTHCMSIYYYFRNGYGNASVQTESTDSVITLEPTDGKWRRFTLQIQSVESRLVHHMTFKLPTVYMEHRPIFALHSPFRGCGPNGFSYINHPVGHGQIPKNLACQTISHDENELFAYVHKTISEPGSLEQSACSLGNHFGKFCNISCRPFLGEEMTCGNVIQCDSDRCTCLPGHSVSNNEDEDKICTSEEQLSYEYHGFFEYYDDYDEESDEDYF